jgi:hypothetical protein
MPCPTPQDVCQRLHGIATWAESGSSACVCVRLGGGGGEGCVCVCVWGGGGVGVGVGGTYIFGVWIGTLHQQQLGAFQTARAKRSLVEDKRLL